MILKCFEQGADGVMVLGCHPGDCHYISGNECARSRIETTWEIMEILGIDRKRLLLKWVSASEGALFAETAKDFTEVIRSLGPLRGESQDDQG
jgi:F420-non-reducing hydrogenase iron-sulfur subunit